MKIPESLRWKTTGKTLGGGGQATVYEVIDKTEDTGNKYALKALGKGKPQQAYERFYREIKAIKSSSHPSIIKVIDHSESGDEFNFYVMELIDGAVSLKKLIESDENPFYRNPLKSLKLFMQIVEVILECSYNLHIVHRDLSPANVLVLPDESIKVIDFGICQIEGEETITLVDEGVGSINYMAPECESGAGGKVTDQSDLYSAGKILWSAITGWKAFSRESAAFGTKSMNDIFPDHPKTWHLQPIFVQTIRHRSFDRGYPGDVLILARKIYSLIEEGYQPLELVAKRCRICGFGELSPAKGQAWGHPPPQGTAFIECDNCGFCFAVTLPVLEKNLQKRRNLS